MNKLYLVVILCMFIMPMVLAEQQSLGTFQQNDCINLIQTCANCSAVSISSVINPESTQVLGLSTMTKTGTSYNKTFCSTFVIGEYVVNGYGDPDGVNTVWTYNFEVTPSGFTGTLGFYCILLFLLSGITVLGFAIKEGWFVVIGGMGFMILGLYSIINGVAGFKDSFMTWTISVFLLGVGAYLAIKSSMELVENINLG